VGPSFDQKDLQEFLSHCQKAVPEVSVISAEVVTRTPLMYYRPDAGDQYSHFLKITVELPKQVGVLAKYLETGKLGDLFGKSKFYDTQTYESNLNFLLRFMVDKEMAGGSWITLPAGKYTILTQEQASSRSLFNVLCDCEDLVSHPATDEGERWSSMAPLRTLTLSIYLLPPDQTQPRLPSAKVSLQKKKGRKPKIPKKGVASASEEADADDDPGSNDDYDFEDDVISLISCTISCSHFPPPLSLALALALAVFSLFP